MSALFSASGNSVWEVKWLTRYLFKLPKKPRRVVRTCLYGVVAGLGAVAFHLGIQFLFSQTYLRFAWESPGTFLFGSLFVILATSLASGWLLYRVAPEAAGSGIPQLKLAFWKDFGYVPWRVVWVKYIAGVLSVGGGSSLGREGPSVHLAGGLASNLAQALGEPKQNRREAAVAGAAAGLAAAFNTPIAAVTFVLEEIVQDLNSRYLGGVLLASLVGAFTVYATIGKHPAFELPPIEDTSFAVYLFVPFVAILAAFIGVIFQKYALKLRESSRQFKTIPVWCRPAVGAFMTWILGCSIFFGTGHLGVFGLGYMDLSLGLNDALAWETAGLLLAAKLVATIFCYSLGGCGGIFAPCLFFGGMCGLFLPGLVEWILPGALLHLGPEDRLMLPIVGMTACLCAVVRAPVTCILIVFEMTHQFSIMPALMLGVLISQAMAHLFTKHNFYAELLIQDGHDLDHVIPPRDLQSWHQLPVSAIANFQPVSLTSMEKEYLDETLKTYPYHAFPMMEEGRVLGILTRAEIEQAVQENRDPVLQPTKWCRPTHTIREIQMMLIESTTGMLLLTDASGSKLIGLVTLHDLLRTQVSMVDNTNKDY